MQTRSKNPPLQYELDIDMLKQKICAKISEEREKVIAANQAHTLMDYLTPTFRKTNTIQLPDLPEEVTFDFKHELI